MALFPFSLTKLATNLAVFSFSLRVHQDIESEKPSGKQKCIHQMNPECLNLSYLYLEEGSCLVCNALTVGSHEFEGSKSFGDKSRSSNENATKVVHREDANRQAAELTVKTDVNAGESKRTLSSELNKLTRIGWYWGKMSRFEAEEKLIDKVPGKSSFLTFFGRQRLPKG